MGPDRHPFLCLPMHCVAYCSLKSLFYEVSLLFLHKKGPVWLERNKIIVVTHSSLFFVGGVGLNCQDMEEKDKKQELKGPITLSKS